MAYIKLTVDHPLVDGETLTFKAPCDNTAVTGLKVYYVTLTEDAETNTTKTFTFKDAHGNNLTNVGNLFTTNAYVKVILDTTNNAAYIQNADTNGYLESNFVKNTDVIPITNGGTGVTTITDTVYTTARYRASALVSVETSPTINGVINWTYE